MLKLIQIINIVFQIYTLLLFARILTSWIPELREYRAVQFIGFYTDPYLNLFRRFIPPLGMIDISPIVAFIALTIIQNMLIKFLIFIYTL